MILNRDENASLRRMLKEEGNRVKRLEEENKDLRDQLAVYKRELGMIVMSVPNVDEINKCRAIISVQGFEGALPVVLAGLTSLPIVSVPTSTGYGVSAKGYTALNTSLSSCTSGISVVNINNGFGAGEAVVRILDVIGNES